MRLTRASHYAISALAHLAARKDNTTVASHVIAKECGTPERFLLKVLHPLVNAGVLHAVKGPHGGYRLARAAKTITLLEVIEAVEGPVRAQVPDLGTKPAKDGVAALQGRLEKVCEAATAVEREKLAKTTLAGLVGKG